MDLQASRGRVTTVAAQQVGAGVSKLTVDGRTPEQQIEECYPVVREIEAETERLLPELLEELEKLGYDQAHGLDRHFADRAGEKEVVGLESLKDQIGIFTGMPERIQVLMLEQTLEDLARVQTELETAFERWEALEALKG